ncbi:hypothetical protein [Duganella vulcania]|uniref:Uncharacterized protein n=1 Tax=Duganella vulcania TaxID=2692166 RepID=A0A845GSR1_9BURK|nr:hypothetical protein [Duganella vulcania]MYM96238.1 hypothetical protein [Duganella vulcania]
MKKEDLILLGMLAAGAVLLLPMFAKKANAATSSPSTGNTYGASEIMRADGWTYYTDGTSIDPNGRYYSGTNLVYDPKGMYAN